MLGKKYWGLVSRVVGLGRKEGGNIFENVLELEMVDFFDWLDMENG